MSMYYEMINARAKTTYTGPTITGDNYEIWVHHWFASAEAVHAEMVSEGLTNTAAFIRDWIEKNRHWSKEYYSK